MPSKAGDAAHEMAEQQEIIWVSSVQVSDRTKTPEELAELERVRLEALEQQRLKRMSAAAGVEDGDADGDADRAEPAQATGGYAARRLKRRKLMSDMDHGPSGELTLNKLCSSPAWISVFPLHVSPL